MADSNLAKFRKLLEELFMFNRADLDFGIYRIMNMKRGEITRFLDSDLLPQVRATLAELKTGDRAELEAELAKASERAKELGVDPETTQKVKELRAKIADTADVDKLENEVFSDLYNFFRRYYDEGDFLSLRRYKEGVYAIPYEGEEVKLHWANHDQYYIKTSENFRDYSFRLCSGERVHFKVVEADTEKDNVKAAPGKERRFILSDTNPVGEESKELVVRFEYRPDDQKRRQDALNAEAAGRIAAKVPVKWRGVLETLAPTEKNPGRTLFEKHLAEYTARNTFDYFIHKDLGGFLRRELDFYIKNEVMHLDDVEGESAVRVEQYLAKIKAIRRIAHKIIDFLAQLENFQKRLWLKKKFVVETNYCVTLDRVPEALYPEIAANDAQREEWVRLFAIDGIKRDLAGQVGYSTPLTVKFLKANPHLILDTRCFGAEFTDRLLSALGDQNGEVDGLLVQAENFQALNLLQERYRGQAECIYIDPPYNTDASPIMYKNGYKVSSWIALMEERLLSSRGLLKDNGVLAAAIDDTQQRELSFLLSEVFPNGLLGTVCVRSNPSGRPTQTGYSVAHEYVLFAGMSPTAVIGHMPASEKQMARFAESDETGRFEWRNLRREGSNSDRSARRYLYYPIYITSETIRVPQMDWDEAKEEWIPKERPHRREQVVYPDNEDGVQKTWRWQHETVMGSLSQLSVRKDRNSRDYVYYKRRPHEDGVVSVSTWFDAKYSATEHGTALLKDMFGDSPFSYPKSVYSVADSIFVGGAAATASLTVDYFAGSGTTAHAVINLNREDGGKRKYILVEMGEYFDTVLKPRIQKVVYSKDWKDGKPVSRDSGISHMFKYIRLESYEDALNNLEVTRTDAQGELLAKHSGVREDYMLRYMLDVETAGSASLLNVKRFEDPFNYKLRIATGSVGETRDMNVDLVETFNYLLGLRVRHIDTIRGFRVVQGASPAGEKVLVIWRNVKEKPNKDLDAFFLKQKYNTRDSEFDLVYVNGDNNLENLKKPDDTWKVRLIEEEFQRLMFDVEDV